MSSQPVLSRFIAEYSKSVLVWLGSLAASLFQALRLMTVSEASSPAAHQNRTSRPERVRTELPIPRPIAVLTTPRTEHALPSNGPTAGPSARVTTLLRPPSTVHCVQCHQAVPVFKLNRVLHYIPNHFILIRSVLTLGCGHPTPYPHDSWEEEYIIRTGH